MEFSSSIGIPPNEEEGPWVRQDALNLISIQETSGKYLNSPDL